MERHDKLALGGAETYNKCTVTTGKGETLRENDSHPQFLVNFETSQRQSFYTRIWSMRTLLASYSHVLYEHTCRGFAMLL